MNNFEVYLQSQRENAGPPTLETRRAGTLDLDLGPLEAHYRRQGEAAFRYFCKFSELWMSPQCREAIEPGASIVFIPARILSEKLQGSEMVETGGEFRELLERTRRTALLVWTIGGRIEEQISRYCEGNERLVGFLLDAATSLLLNEMHNVLRALVKEEALSLFSLFPIAEYYPGVGSPNSSLIRPILDISDADRRLGLATNDQMMIHPKKSQCSVVLLGEEKDSRILVNSPCIPCQGKKCMYFQLGGCHVGRAGGSVTHGS